MHRLEDQQALGRIGHLRREPARHVGEPHLRIEAIVEAAGVVTAASKICAELGSGPERASPGAAGRCAGGEPPRDSEAQDDGKRARCGATAGAARFAGRGRVATGRLHRRVRGVGAAMESKVTSTGSIGSDRRGAGHHAAPWSCGQDVGHRPRAARLRIVAPRAASRPVSAALLRPSDSPQHSATSRGISWTAGRTNIAAKASISCRIC